MTTIMMLRGMMLECLFKGILVNQGQITCKNEKLQLPNKYPNHDLISMSDDIENLSLNTSKKQIIEKLGYYIIAGRLPRKKINIGKFKGYWSDSDEKIYNDLIEEVEKVLLTRKISK
jgi:hypothetical protein